jgi:hypothetical protein
MGRRRSAERPSLATDSRVGPGPECEALAGTEHPTTLCPGGVWEVRVAEIQELDSFGFIDIFYEHRHGDGLVNLLRIAQHHPSTSP